MLTWLLLLAFKQCDELNVGLILFLYWEGEYIDLLIQRSLMNDAEQVARDFMPKDAICKFVHVETEKKQACRP